MRDSDRSKYWATLSGVELMPKLEAKIDAYHEYLKESQLAHLWERAHLMYQWGAECSTIQKVGDEGEFDSIKVNHARNIVRHIVVGTTSSRPGYQTRAQNTDYKSKVACRLGDGVLEYYIEGKRCEQHANRCAEMSAVLGEGNLFEWWDRNAGKLIGAEAAPSTEDPAEQTEEPEQIPVFEGDLRVETPHPMDVIRDVTRRTPDGNPWVIVRRRVSRYDLAALYRDQAEKILALEEDTGTDWYARSVRILNDPEDTESDDLCVYYFVHTRTPSLPTGRMFVFCGDDIELEDATFDELKEEPGLTQMIPDPIQGSPFGYTFFFDLMEIQDAINVGHSTALTNLSNFGVTNLSGPAGATMKFEQLAKGLNWLGVANVREGKIEVLDLLQIPEALVAIVQMWEQAMETLSGVNSVARGNPEASLKSGAALALVQSQFLQFTEDYQRAYFFMWAEFCTKILKLFRANVSEKRAAAIVGKGDRAYVKELIGADLENIDRVRVEPASALARTAAGRLQIAEDMIANGWITTPEQYMAVRETGKLEPLTHHPTAQLDLITAENEALQEGNPAKPVLDDLGKPVIQPAQLDPASGQLIPEQPLTRPSAVVLLTDDHVLHVKEHSALMCDPDVRLNETVMAATLAHIQEHLNALQTMDPVLAAVLGFPSIGGAPGGPAGAGAPPPGASPGSPETQQAVNPVNGNPAQVRKPTNPQSGREWDPSSGGLAA